MLFVVMKIFAGKGFCEILRSLRIHRVVKFNLTYEAGNVICEMTHYSLTRRYLIIYCFNLTQNHSDGVKLHIY